MTAETSHQPAGRVPSLLQLIRAARNAVAAEIHKMPREEIGHVSVKLRVCEELLTALDADQLDAAAVEAAGAQAEADDAVPLALPPQGMEVATAPPRKR